MFLVIFLYHFLIWQFCCKALQIVKCIITKNTKHLSILFVDDNGKVTTIYCTYDPETKSGSGCTKKVKGTIYWVNANHSKQVECRLFENLIDEESAEEVEGQEHATEGYKINPNSKQVLDNCFVEDIDFDVNERYQFVLNGYFCLDSDSIKDKLVFNRTISLKETKKV